jgi:CDP-diglyceride synthetase
MVISNRLQTMYVRSRTGIIILAATVILLTLPPWLFTLSMLGIFQYIVATEWPTLRQAVVPTGWQTLLLTTVYLILPFFCLIYLYANPLYRPLLTLMIVLIFVHDTGAYLGGTFFGKHPILPAVSPKKSWEGWAGGLLVTLPTFIFMVWLLFGTQLTFVHALIMTVILSVTAVSGDFFESWLKRKAGVKDTGTLLPGHGGLLDRIDSILFVVVIVTLFRTTIVLWCGSAP